LLLRRTFQIALPSLRQSGAIRGIGGMPTPSDQGKDSKTDHSPASNMLPKVPKGMDPKLKRTADAIAVGPAFPPPKNYATPPIDHSKGENLTQKLIQRQPKMTTGHVPFSTSTAASTAQRKEKPAAAGHTPASSSRDSNSGHRSKDIDVAARHIGKGQQESSGKVDETIHKAKDLPAKEQKGMHQPLSTNADYLRHKEASDKREGKPIKEVTQPTEAVGAKMREEKEAREKGSHAGRSKEFNNIPNDKKFF